MGNDFVNIPPVCGKAEFAKLPMISRRWWLVLCTAIVAGLAVSDLSMAEPSKPRAPRPSGKVINVKKTIEMNQKGKTYDFKGATLVWKGKGNCSQKEGMPPIIKITADNVTLKNVTILKAPDGIHVDAKKVRIERVSFPDVCEDAITMKKNARDVVVKRCFFARATDKVIQASYGRDHVVAENTFVDVSQALRVKKGVRVRFVRNVVHRGMHAVHVDGKSARASAGSNVLYKVDNPYKAEKQGKIVREAGDKILR